MNAQLSQDEWVATVEMNTECNEKWILDYYLQRLDAKNEDEQDITFFGIRVDKSNPEGVLHEREATHAITENHETALEMARAFAKGIVPPVTLLEMTDEWLSESEAADFQSA